MTGVRGTRRDRSAPAALGLLTGLNILNYTDRYIGPAVLPLILASLALTDAQGGLLQSVFIVAYSLMSPLAGWAGDRRPRLPLAAAGRPRLERRDRRLGNLLGDAASPWLIGIASDRLGLKAPVLATGLLLTASEVVLLLGRGALERDLGAVASAPVSVEVAGSVGRGHQ